MQKFLFLAPRQGKLLQFKSVTTQKKHFVVYKNACSNYLRQKPPKLEI